MPDIGPAPHGNPARVGHSRAILCAEVFQRVVVSNALVGGFDFPFPALGRVRALGNGYAFEPVD